jgi:hypothetical protein
MWSVNEFPLQARPRAVFPNARPMAGSGSAQKKHLDRRETIEVMFVVSYSSTYVLEASSAGFGFGGSVDGTSSFTGSTGTCSAFSSGTGFNASCSVAVELTAQLPFGQLPPFSQFPVEQPVAQPPIVGQTVVGTTLQTSYSTSRATRRQFMRVTV